MVVLKDGSLALPMNVICNSGSTKKCQPSMINKSYIYIY